VSHDRALIDAVATHTLSLEGGDAVMRTGGYADLVALREAAAEDDAPPARAAAKPKKRDDQAARKGGNGRAAREVSKIETRIATLESQLAEVGVEVEAAGVAGDVDRVVELGERHRQLEEELAYALAEWEERAAMLAEGS
jgi:ATPase subunit of ABC transporter with duplicated ATPase domains